MAHQTIEIELNPPDRRLYDRMRLRVVGIARSPSTGIADLLVFLPDLTVLLARLLRDERVLLGDKAIALLGVGYVLSPIDLLPAFLLGPLGLVDDLLIVTAALSRIVNHVHPDIVRAHWPGKGDALEVIQRVSGWSENALTGRLRGAFDGLLGR